MNSNRLAMSINGDKIHYSQRISVVDTTLYPTHTDSIGNIYEEVIWTGTLNQDLELESSKFYTIDTKNYSIRANTFISRKYKNGVLLFYQATSKLISFSLPRISQYHFLHINENNLLTDYKLIQHSNGGTGTPSLPYFEVLSNNEILLGAPLREEKILEFYKIDSDWEDVNAIGYERLIDQGEIVGAMENYSSTIRRSAHPSLLTQDGILINLYSQGTTRIDKSNFYLFPLNNEFTQCAPFTDPFPFDLIDSTLELHKLQPGVASAPTRIEMEDIYLKRRVRTFVSETVCESTYTPEDYALSILDTICDPSGSLNITVEVCREDRLPQQNVSLDFYFESPLEQEGAPFLEEEILFLEGQTCVQKTYFLQGVGFYMLVNGDTERKRPYTLSKTFFDANEGIEYDYTNNMAFANICENTVSTSQEIPEPIALNIYPNPASQQLNIDLEKESITEIEIYNSQGLLIHKAKVNAVNYQMDIKTWTSGLYIIRASISNGRSAIAKFTKLDSF